MKTQQFLFDYFSFDCLKFENVIILHHDSLLFEKVEHDFWLVCTRQKTHCGNRTGLFHDLHDSAEREAQLRQHDNLLLQLLLREDEPSHDVIELFQSQLGMEHSDVIRIRANHPLQSSVEVQQNLTENLGKKGTMV